jgi:putative transposase
MRCNNKEFLFKDSEDFLTLLHFLKKYKEHYGYKVYNYTVMSNHVHLLLEPRPAESLSASMRDVMVNYAKWYHRVHQRKGHFWESRYKTTIIENDAYALTCMRYINRNPIRAKMVDDLDKYPWSGYHFYAQGEANGVTDPIGSYLALSPYVKVRQRKYTEFVNTPFDAEKDKRDPAISDLHFFGSVGFQQAMAERRR